LIFACSWKSIKVKSLNLMFPLLSILFMTDRFKRKGLCFGRKVVMDKKLPPLFLGQFSFRPIIFFVFVFSFSLFQQIWSENAVGAEEVGGSIWSFHCQKSTLRYVKTTTITCCGLVRTGLLSPTTHQSTSKGRR
jgi:hypothetical protein